MPSNDTPKLYNKYSPFVFLKKLEKVKITGECFVNLKIIDDAFAHANMTSFLISLVIENPSLIVSGMKG